MVSRIIIATAGMRHSGRETRLEPPRLRGGDGKEAALKSYRLSGGRTAQDHVVGRSDKPGTARSLQEGLEETLTVTRLELHEDLIKTFASTKLIESCLSRAEEFT